jgi:alpha-L-rhamnosidase
LYLWQLLEKTNAALDREDEARHCRAHLDRIRPLVHREFFDPARHLYRPEEQAYQVLPLATGVTPAAEQERVVRGLEDLILVRRHGHLDTGMLGTYFLLDHLQAIGRNDLVFTIVNQRTYPGWGYMLDQGATTNWEQWNGYWSQIHSCFTSVGGWFYGGLAGIRPDPAAPGFKRIIIRPAVVGDVQWVQAAFRSIHGTIESNWCREGGRFTLEVTVPVNTTATVCVPAKDPAAVTEGGRAATAAEGVRFLRAEDGCAVFAVASGKYGFVSEMKP